MISPEGVDRIFETGSKDTSWGHITTNELRFRSTLSCLVSQKKIKENIVPVWKKGGRKGSQSRRLWRPVDHCKNCGFHSKENEKNVQRGEAHSALGSNQH